jgi:hypothetical protein
MADVIAAGPRPVPRIRIARLRDFALIPPIIAIAHALEIFGPIAACSAATGRERCTGLRTHKGLGKMPTEEEK